MRLKLATILLLVIFVTYVCARPSQEDNSEEVDSDEDKDDDDDNDNDDSEDEDNSDSKQSNKPPFPTPVVTSDGGYPSYVDNLKKIAAYLEKFIHKYISSNSTVTTTYLNGSLSNATESKKPAIAAPALLQSLSNLLQALKKPAKPGSAKPMPSLTQMPALLEMLKPLVNSQQTTTTTQGPIESTTAAGISSQNATEATTELTTLVEAVTQNGTGVAPESTTPVDTVLVNGTKPEVGSPQAAYDIAVQESTTGPSEPISSGVIPENSTVSNIGSSLAVENGTLNEYNSTIQDQLVTDLLEAIQNTLNFSGGLVASQDIAMAENSTIAQNSTGIEVPIPATPEITAQSQNITLANETTAGLEQVSIGIPADTQNLTGAGISMLSAVDTNPDVTTTQSNNLGSSISSLTDAAMNIYNPETTTVIYGAELSANTQNETPSIQDQTPPAQYPTIAENPPIPQNPNVFEASPIITGSVIIDSVLYPQASEVPATPQTPSVYETPAVNQYPSAIETPVDTQYPFNAQSSLPASNYPVMDVTSAATPINDAPFFLQNPSAIEDPEPIGDLTIAPSISQNQFGPFQDLTGVISPLAIQSANDVKPQAAGPDFSAVTPTSNQALVSNANPVVTDKVVPSEVMSNNIQQAANELLAMNNPTAFPENVASTLPSEPLSIPNPTPAPPVQEIFDTTAKQPIQTMELIPAYEQTSQFIEPLPYVPQPIFETQPQTPFQPQTIDSYISSATMNAMQQAEAEAVSSTPNYINALAQVQPSATFDSNTVIAMEQAEAEAVSSTSNPVNQMELAEAEAIFASTNANNAMGQAEANAISPTINPSFAQPEELTQFAASTDQNNNLPSVHYPLLNVPTEGFPPEFSMFENEPENLAFFIQPNGQVSETLSEASIIAPPSQSNPLEVKAPITSQQNESQSYLGNTLQVPSSQAFNSQIPPSETSNAPGSAQDSGTSSSQSPQPLSEISSSTTYPVDGGYEASDLYPIQTSETTVSLPLDTQGSPNIQQNTPEFQSVGAPQPSPSQTFNPSVLPSEALNQPDTIGQPINWIEKEYIQTTEPTTTDSFSTLSSEMSFVTPSNIESYPVQSSGLLPTSDLTSSGSTLIQAPVLTPETSASTTWSGQNQLSDPASGSISSSVLGTTTPTAILNVLNPDSVASQSSLPVQWTGEQNQLTGSPSYSPEPSINQESAAGATGLISSNEPPLGITVSSGSIGSFVSGPTGSQPSYGIVSSSANTLPLSASEPSVIQPSYGTSGPTGSQSADVTTANTITSQNIDAPSSTQLGSQPSYATPGASNFELTLPASQFSYASNSGSPDPLTNIDSPAYAQIGTQPGPALEDSISTGNTVATSSGGLSSQPSYSTGLSSADPPGSIGTSTLDAVAPQAFNGISSSSIAPINNIGNPSPTPALVQSSYATSPGSASPINAGSSGPPLGASNFETQFNAYPADVALPPLSSAAGIALAEMALANAGLADPLPIEEVTSSPDILLPTEIMASEVTATAPSTSPLENLPLFDSTASITIPAQANSNIGIPSNLGTAGSVSTQTASTNETPLAETALAQAGLADPSPNAPVAALPNVALPTEIMVPETIIAAPDLGPPGQLPVFDPNNFVQAEPPLTPLSGPAGIALAEAALAAAGLADPLPIEQVTASPIYILPTEAMLPETATTATIPPSPGPNEQLPVFDPTSIGTLVQLSPVESTVEMQPVKPLVLDAAAISTPVNDPTVQDLLPIDMADIDALFNDQTTQEATTQGISTRPTPSEVVLSEILPADIIPIISLGGGPSVITPPSPSSVVSANQQQSQDKPVANQETLPSPGPYVPPVNQISDNLYGPISNYPTTNQAPIFNYNQDTPPSSYAPGNEYGGYPMPTTTPKQPINMPLGNYQTILDEGALVGPMIGPDGDVHFPPPMVVETDYPDPAAFEQIIAAEYLKPRKGSRKTGGKKGIKNEVDKNKTAGKLEVKKPEKTEPAVNKTEAEEKVVKPITNNETIQLEAGIPANKTSSRVARNEPPIREYAKD